MHALLKSNITILCKPLKYKGPDVRNAGIQTIIDVGVVVVPSAEHPVVEAAEHNEQEAAAGGNGECVELV